MSKSSEKHKGSAEAAVQSSSTPRLLYFELGLYYFYASVAALMAIQASSSSSSSSSTSAGGSGELEGLLGGGTFHGVIITSSNFIICILTVLGLITLTRLAFACMVSSQVCALQSLLAIKGEQADSAKVFHSGGSHSGSGGAGSRKSATGSKQHSPLNHRDSCSPFEVALQDEEQHEKLALLKAGGRQGTSVFGHEGSGGSGSSRTATPVDLTSSRAPSISTKEGKESTTTTTDDDDDSDLNGTMRPQSTKMGVSSATYDNTEEDDDGNNMSPEKEKELETTVEKLFNEYHNVSAFLPHSHIQAVSRQVTPAISRVSSPLVSSLNPASRPTPTSTTGSVTSKSFGSPSAASPKETSVLQPAKQRSESPQKFSPHAAAVVPSLGDLAKKLGGGTTTTTTTTATAGASRGSSKNLSRPRISTNNNSLAGSPKESVGGILSRNESLSSPVKFMTSKASSPLGDQHRPVFDTNFPEKQGSFNLDAAGARSSVNSASGNNMARPSGGDNTRDSFTSISGASSPDAKYPPDKTKTTKAPDSNKYSSPPFSFHSPHSTGTPRYHRHAQAGSFQPSIWDSVERSSKQEGTTVHLQLRLHDIIDENQSDEALLSVMERISMVIGKVLGILMQYDGVIHFFDMTNVIATFNIHRPCPEHCSRAIWSSLAIAYEIEPLLGNCPWGIGIAQGTFLAGHTGTRELRSYVVFGTAMRVAEDLAALNFTLGTRILLEESIHDEVNGEVFAVLVDYFIHPLTTSVTGVFELRGDKDVDRYFFTQEHMNKYLEGFSALCQGSLQHSLDCFKSLAGNDVPASDGQCVRLLHLATVFFKGVETLELPYHRALNTTWVNYEEKINDVNSPGVPPRRMGATILSSDALETGLDESNSLPESLASSRQDGAGAPPSALDTTLVASSDEQTPGKAGGTIKVVTPDGQEYSVPAAVLKSTAATPASQGRNINASGKSPNPPNLADMLLESTSSLNYQPMTPTITRRKDGTSGGVGFNSSSYKESSTMIFEAINRAQSCHTVMSGGGSSGGSTPIPMDVGALLPEPMHLDGVRSFYDTHNILWKQSLKQLGRGSFGEVFLGMRGVDGKLVAMKILPVVSNDNAASISPQSGGARGARGQAGSAQGTQAKIDTLKSEIQMLIELRHENIVSFLGCGVDRMEAILIMEYVSGGSLLTILKEFGTVPLAATQRYVKDTLRGLSYLHRKGVIHRDIKPENVLLHVNGRCKVTDFGSTMKINLLSDNKVVGTPIFMAPEQAKGPKQTVPASDLWSVGVMTIVLLTGKTPYPMEKLGSEHALLFQLAFNTSFAPEVPTDIHPAAQEFIQKCLQRDPKDRGTADELLMNPFLLTSLEDPALTGSLKREGSMWGGLVSPSPEDHPGTEGTIDSLNCSFHRRGVRRFNSGTVVESQKKHPSTNPLGESSSIEGVELSSKSNSGVQLKLDLESTSSEVDTSKSPSPDPPGGKK